MEWAKRQRNDVTVRQPMEDGIWVVYDRSTHMLRAKGTAEYVHGVILGWDT